MSFYPSKVDLVIMVQIFLNQLLDHFGIHLKSQVVHGPVPLDVSRRSRGLNFKAVMGGARAHPGPPCAYPKKGCCCKEEGRDIIVSLAIWENGENPRKTIQKTIGKPMGNHPIMSSG